jgi:hypothetical protein
MKHPRPKTADGVPIRAGMILYFRRNGELPHCVRVGSVRLGVARTNPPAALSPPRIIETRRAYATFEAAQAERSRT